MLVKIRRVVGAQIFQLLGNHIHSFLIGNGLPAAFRAQHRLGYALRAVDKLHDGQTLWAHSPGGPAVSFVADKKVEGLEIRDLKTNLTRVLPANGVFVAVGITPRTELVKDIVALTEGGSIFVGAVRDMDRKDDLRAAIRERALATGDQSALLRFEGSAELFVPRRFFSAWAAECPYPVEVKFSPAKVSHLNKKINQMFISFSDS